MRSKESDKVKFRNNDIQTMELLFFRSFCVLDRMDSAADFCAVYFLVTTICVHIEASLSHRE